MTEESVFDEMDGIMKFCGVESFLYLWASL